jgi:hypothetical protein
VSTANTKTKFSLKSKIVLAVSVLVVIVLLGAATYAERRPPIRTPFKPVIEQYFCISVTPHELDLGNVPHPGLYDSPAILTVHVAADCEHGGVVASATPLQHPEGTIPPERIFVRILPTGGYVSMDAPVVITGPAGPGVFDVELKFRLETVFEDPAGTYTGTFTFTCNAP